SPARNDDPRPLVEERVQLELGAYARLRQSDVDERPGVPEHRQTLRDGLGTADDVEHEVELLARADVRRTEPPRCLELALVEIERVDLLCAGDACSLHGREADRAATDHADACALPDLRRLEYRAYAGRDRAADYACLLGRQALRDADRGRLVDDGARRERAELQRLEELVAVRAQPSRPARRGAAAAPVPPR